MQYIKQSIDKSKIWNFKRRVLNNNEFYASIDDGVIKWILQNDNEYLYQESGTLVFQKNNNEENSDSINFFHTLIFVFNGNQYTVYRNNGSIFYKSNKKNKSSQMYNNTRYDVDVKYINNLITTKVDITGKKKFSSSITNYYPI